MSKQNFSENFAKFSSSVIDFFDVFGQLPNFRVLNKAKQTSSLGFFLTIFLVITTLSYLITEIISMIQKSQPSMIASETLIFDTTAFELKNDNFTLALSVADVNNYAIEGLNKYYTMEIRQCVRKRFEDAQSGNISIQLECTDIPFETCNKSHFTTELQQNYFQRIKLGSLQCINREFLKQTPPVLKGQLNAMSFHFVQIHLKICKNTTEISTCASHEEIVSKLQSAQYNIYSSDYLLQLSRSNEPLEQIITPQFSSFSATTSKKILQYYGIFETTTDDGLLLESTKSQANLKKGELEQYQELYNGQYLINHYIVISSVQTNYFRSYIKLQTILAKIGGIWQIFLIVFSFLFRGLLYDLMLLKVSNKLFPFLDNNGSCQLISTTTQIKSNNKSEEVYTFFESFKILFGFDKIKNQLFQKAKSTIMKKLDIVRIIKNLHRLEILTSILLNEKQQKALIALSKLQVDMTNQQSSPKKTKETYAINTNRGDDNEIKIELNSNINGNNNHIIKYPNSDRVASIYQDLKVSRSIGLESEINNKLLPFLEKIYLNGNSDMNSPIVIISQDPIIDSDDGISEPQTQKVK